MDAVEPRCGAPADLIDIDRYPLTRLQSPHGRAVIDELRGSLAEKRVAIVPGFIRPEAVQQMAAEFLELRPRAHREDVWGSPYLAPPDDSYEEGHPRRASVHSLTWVLAYDLIPPRSPLRALYEWDPLLDFISAVLDRRPLYRMRDPLSALNATIMDEQHVQGWHYDGTDFVVSLAVQASERGGLFECAPLIRTHDDENYENVARVLAGEVDDLVEVFPMTPGTLMIFEGRYSIHRVSPVQGDVPRVVALMGYDTKPDTMSSDLLKRIRYGRTEPIAAGD